jgi:hypothetical protein
VYVGNRKNMLVDMGAGTDTLYLTGHKADWSIARTNASALKAYLELADRTNATAPTWNTTIASNDPARTDDVLPGDGGVEQAYRFTTTNPAGAVREVTVFGAERYAFFDNGVVPRSTVNLVA